jgi:hypothetical protein
MAYFLSEERRSTLIDNLCCLGMPRTIAEDHGSLSDKNLVYLDKNLAAVVWRVSERCQQLQDPATHHNEQRAIALTILLAADTMILATYTAELKHRKLPAVQFPRSTKAIDFSAEEIAVAIRMVLTLGDEGTTQQ